MVTITCARCGFRQPVEGEMVTPSGRITTPEGWLEALRACGYDPTNLVCQECMTGEEADDSTSPRLDVDRG